MLNTYSYKGYSCLVYKKRLTNKKKRVKKNISNVCKPVNQMETITHSKILKVLIINIL